MRRRKLFAGALATAAVIVGTAAPAFADRLVIRKVDTTQFPKVSVTALVEGTQPAPGSWNVRENEQLVRQIDVAPLSKTTGLAVAVVVDTSAAMGDANRMDAVKTTLRDWVAKKAANEQVAIVAAGPQPQVFQDFTADARPLNAAIDKLTPHGQPALWDGIRRTVALFEGAPNLQHDVVVVAAGNDTVSKATAEQARAGVLDARASLFAVGFRGAGVSEGPLSSMAGATGGTYVGADGIGALTSAMASFQRSLRDNQFVVEYDSTAKGAITVDLSTDKLRAKAPSVNVGTVAQGATKPEVVKPSGVSVFRGSAGKYVAVLLVLAAAGLIAYAIASLVIGERAGLDMRLQPYSDPAAQPDEDEGGSSYAQTAFVQRAVEVTANIAEQRGVLVKLASKLEQADLPLRPAEALFFYLAGAAIVTLLSFVVFGFFAGVVLFAMALLLPFGVLNFLAGRRKKKFTSQLPDMLQLLAGSLRAGYSLLQGVEAVAQECQNPMAYELNRVLIEARLGRPLEDALEEAAARLGSPDFEWAVMAIRIQREVGGNLAELLQTVAETMVHRERLRREVKALTAEGRMSAIVLGCLPVGLAAVMFTINPEYMRVLFTDSFGKLLLGGGTVMALFGFWWMKKCIDIEI